MLRDVFRNRVLPFDSAATCAYADIAAMRRSIGRSIPLVDGQVAAIARSRSMTVAMCNVRDFEDTRIEIIDPWRMT